MRIEPLDVVAVYEYKQAIRAWLSFPLPSVTVALTWALALEETAAELRMWAVAQYRIDYSRMSEVIADADSDR